MISGSLRVQLQAVIDDDDDDDDDAIDTWYKFTKTKFRHARK